MMGCHVYSNMIGVTPVGLHTCVLARRLRASVQWSPSRLPPGDGRLDSGLPAPGVVLGATLVQFHAAFADGALTLGNPYRGSACLTSKVQFV